MKLKNIILIAVLCAAAVAQARPLANQTPKVIVIVDYDYPPAKPVPMPRWFWFWPWGGVFQAY